MPPAVPRPQELRTAAWGRSRQACRCLAEGCGTILIDEPTPNQTGLPAPGPALGERRAYPGIQQRIPPQPFELLMTSTPSTADGYQCGRSWAQLDALAMPEVSNLPRISIALAKARRRLRALSCWEGSAGAQELTTRWIPRIAVMRCQLGGSACSTMGSRLLRATHGANSGPIPPRGIQEPPWGPLVLQCQGLGPFVLTACVGPALAHCRHLALGLLPGPVIHTARQYSYLSGLITLININYSVN